MRVSTSGGLGGAAPERIPLPFYKSGRIAIYWHNMSQFVAIQSPVSNVALVMIVGSFRCDVSFLQADIGLKVGILFAMASMTLVGSKTCV